VKAVRQLSRSKLSQSHVVIVLYASALVLAGVLLVASRAKTGESAPVQSTLSVTLPPYDPDTHGYTREADLSDYVPSIIPVDMTDGRVSSEFGMRVHPVHKVRRMHCGIDLAVDTGTPVVATADGVVEFASRRGGYGNLVIVDHLTGFKTRYAHLSKFEVEVGDYVRRGDIVGLVGMTGTATGPHLHYEVRILDSSEPVKGVEQNPRYFLPDGFDTIVAKQPEDTAVGDDADSDAETAGADIPDTAN
jgi:murein DD-endopeptidase MepM/ murein hydrolase activator NlpD